MTTTMAREFLRLIEKLHETDPSTQAYLTLLQSIECLNSIGTTIEEMLTESMAAIARQDPVTAHADWVEGQEGKVVELSVVVDPEKVPVHPIPTPPFEAADFPAEVKDDLVKEESVKEEVKTYTSAQVRKALVDARNSGTDVRALLAEFGADNFGAVPEGKYAELMARLGA